MNLAASSSPSRTNRAVKPPRGSRRAFASNRCLIRVDSFKNSSRSQAQDSNAFSDLRYSRVTRCLWESCTTARYPAATSRTIGSDMAAVACKLVEGAARKTRQQGIYAADMQLHPLSWRQSMEKRRANQKESHLSVVGSVFPNARSASIWPRQSSPTPKNFSRAAFFIMSASIMGIPAGAPRPTDPASLASVNAAAALRNYKLQPRLDYSTISGVSGPLVVSQFVKVRRRPSCLIPI